MDTVELLASALGIGFLSGFRLYLTVLSLGAAIRFDVLRLSDKAPGLTVLADWRVMLAAALLAAVEFVADKVPWIDSTWDAVHTFIRPVAAGLVAAAALGQMDPALKTILALMAGGVALSSHSAKAATRLAVNHSPEPFSNWALSIGEDLAAPIGFWLLLSHPLVLMGVVVAFLVVFFWMAGKVWRWMRRLFSSQQKAVSRQRSAAHAHRVPSKAER